MLQHILFHSCALYKLNWNLYGFLKIKIAKTTLNYDLLNTGKKKKKEKKGFNL